MTTKEKFWEIMANCETKNYSESDLEYVRQIYHYKNNLVLTIFNNPDTPLELDYVFNLNIGYVVGLGITTGYLKSLAFRELSEHLKTEKILFY